VAEDTLSDTLDVIRSKMAIEALAKRRVGFASPGAASRATRYRESMKYYAPLNNDQWPEDRYMRPGKVHVTANIVRAYCDIAARLLSIPPRLVNKPIAANQENRRRAEDIERFFYRLLDLSGWDVWLNDWALAGEIFGVGILQPFWNAATGTPDVNVIEQPQNLMFGYGTNDYSVVDWAVYRYTVSFIEAQSRWPEAGIMLNESGGPVVAGTPVEWGAADKADIVNQKTGSSSAEGGNVGIVHDVTSGEHYEEYEHSQHLEAWDYWYRADGSIYNATLLAGRIVDGPTKHPELPIIPYLMYEAGHEPGSPEGLDTPHLLRDVQMGYNRALSLWTQYTLDNSGTAYQVKGPTSGDIPDGAIPLSDEMIPVGENEIVPIQRNQNTFPINQLVDQYWELASRLTGIPAILFGQLAGAQTSGRATAVQIEAALNRLDPKRRRFYQTLKDLLRVWGFMLSYRNTKIEVIEPVDQQQMQPGAPQAQEPEMQVKKIGLKQMLDGFDNWKIVAPEITPRDSVEATTNAANKVQAHLMSIESAMDEIGVEDPQHEMDLIRRELADARLNPGQVQAYISALQLLDQLVQMQAQQAQAAQAGQQGQDVQQAQDQQAQPTGLEDQNQPGTMPGGPPAPGAAAPGSSGLQLQGLIRQKSGEATAMSQVVLPPLGTR
jgi:hypothetical protein